MTNFCIYVGITLVIAGCLIGLCGAVWYWRKLQDSPDLPEYRAELRTKFARIKMAWFVLAISGCLVTFLPALF